MRVEGRPELLKGREARRYVESDVTSHMGQCDYFIRLVLILRMRE